LRRIEADRVTGTSGSNRKFADVRFVCFVIVEVTAHEVTLSILVTDADRFWGLLATDVEDLRATVGEGATGWWVDELRVSAFGWQFAEDASFWIRHCFQ
jgi:hypothetical protein